MDFYQLSSKSPSPETPDKAWFAEAKRTTLCGDCSAVRVSGHPFEVVLQTKPDDSALNFVHGVCVHIASVSLLGTLFPEGPAKFLLLGKVFGPDRKEASEFRTITAENRVIVRGNERSTFRICSECGRILYSAIGHRYILKRDIEDRNIFESQSGNLVLAEPIAKQSLRGKWRNLVVQKLDIRDEPIDGLQLPK